MIVAFAHQRISGQRGVVARKMKYGTDNIACRTLNQASIDQLLEMLATAVCRTVRRTDPRTGAPCWYRCVLDSRRRVLLLDRRHLLMLEQWIIVMCSL